MLSVGLSRLLRANPEIRAIDPRAFHRDADDGRAAGGLRRVRSDARASGLLGRTGVRDEPLRFRQYLEPHPGEKVVLVDDILRTGGSWRRLKELLEKRGATVVGLAVMVYQPTPDTRDFGSLPLYYLAKLEASYYADAAHCEMCKRGVPCEKVLIQ